MRRFKGLSAIITTDSISLKPTIYFLIYYYLSIKVLIDNFRCIRGKLAFPYCQTSFWLRENYNCKLHLYNCKFRLYKCNLQLYNQNLRL